MGSTRYFLVLYLFALALAPRAAGEEPDIRRLVSELGADSFLTREKATQALFEIGVPAVPLLESAAHSESEEVRFRATTLAFQILHEPYFDDVAAFCALPDDALDLERGLWLITRILNPKVKQADLTRGLDDLAQRVKAKLGKDMDASKADPQAVMTAIQQVMFHELKYNCNRDDYQNPDNCSLEYALKTGKGRPVLISHIIVALGRRLDVPIVGVPASGMYLVRYDGSQAPKGFSQHDIYLSPYEDGAILSRDDRQRFYPAHDPDKMAPPATNREVLDRILTNLIGTLSHDADRQAQYQQARDFATLLDAPVEP